MLRDLLGGDGFVLGEVAHAARLFPPCPRKLHGVAVITDVLADGAADVGDGNGGELEAAGRIKHPRCLHQPDVTSGLEVVVFKPGADAVLPSEGSHQSEVLRGECL